MRCVHAKQRHKGCIRHQRHSKRRTLAPATDLRGTASGLSTALLTSLGVDRDDRVIIAIVEVLRGRRLVVVRIDLKPGP